ncbi:MAG: hypothetical protein DRR42_08230 [Gammaproteobacteria bacterium]|nr:MAG: hypothetical protein DRR42_08230 [Gammaproteobacteria bacterium]
MSDNELSLRAINDLLEERFCIPAYQRGYRWTSRQVEDLLNDVLEFSEKEMKSAKEFYCLQPIVVRQVDGKWELIDGQQRLTTVYIILSYFNRRLAEGYRKDLFSIEYATRPDSKAYLDDINEAQKDRNIDFYHIYESYQTIETWFQDKTNLINDIESVFLNKVKVIWYDVKEDIDPVEVFTRLNIGKIPLTNAELVKALFLRSRNFGDNVERTRLMQLKISQEWDEIERALQNDSLWYFLTNEDTYDTRIEFILDLMVSNFGTAHDISSDHYRTFIAFNRWFQEENPVLEKAWMEVKYYFMQLEEWHRDRYLFHLLGFLINQGVDIEELKTKSQAEETKEAFRASLRSRIFGMVFRRHELEDYPNREDIEAVIKEQLGEWNYGSQSGLIRSALLLFNIASLIRNSFANQRFQFDKYKNDHWDLEHIKSVRSNMPERTDEQKLWLANILEYLLGSRSEADYRQNIANIQSKRVRVICENAVSALDSTPFDWQLFERVYRATLRYFKEAAESETDDSIANLALLDAHTNRSYQNAVFPIKRNRIIGLDKEGAFVPLCTKNAFLKYYSNRVENMMFWAEQDREFYLEAIVEMLVWFFAEDHEVLQ